MNKQNKNIGYFTIQSWMVTELKLKTIERDMFAIIYGFSQDGEGSFHSSLKWASDITGYSKNSICTALNNLNMKGLITKTPYLGTQKYSYKANLEKIETIQATCTDENIAIQATCTDEGETIQATCIVNKDNLINKKENNKIKEYKSKDIQEIVDLYNEICVSLPKVIKPTEKRRKGIQALIKKGYTINDFRDAFELAEQSDFLTGKNDRGWKANFDFFLREDKFVKILEGDYGGRKRNITDREGMSKSVERYTQEEKQQIRKGLKDGKYERI